MGQGIDSRVDSPALSLAGEAQSETGQKLLALLEQTC
jgi:hypothetical protein